MNVCVVGSGPTAEGKGEQIDACDFVVRMKAFWAHGAANAGEKTSAVAWYGDTNGWETCPDNLRCECWITHPVPVFCRLKPESGYGRLLQITERASLGVIRWMSFALWQKVQRHGKLSFPSTGILAVAMAMEICRPAELVLYGMDSTVLGAPNFEDARRKLSPRERARLPHDVRAEKRIIAELFNGQWLGKPSPTRLEWPEKPEGV